MLYFYILLSLQSNFVKYNEECSSEWSNYHGDNIQKRPNINDMNNALPLFDFYTLPVAEKLYTIFDHIFTQVLPCDPKVNTPEVAHRYKDRKDIIYLWVCQDMLNKGSIEINAAHWLLRSYQKYLQKKVKNDVNGLTMSLGIDKIIGCNMDSYTIQNFVELLAEDEPKRDLLVDFIEYFGKKVIISQQTFCKEKLLSYNNYAFYLDVIYKHLIAIQRGILKKNYAKPKERAVIPIHIMILPPKEQANGNKPNVHIAYIKSDFETNPDNESEKGGFVGKCPANNPNDKRCPLYQQYTEIQQDEKKQNENVDYTKQNYFSEEAIKSAKILTKESQLADIGNIEKHRKNFEYQSEDEHNNKHQISQQNKQEDQQKILTDLSDYNYVNDATHQYIEPMFTTASKANVTQNRPKERLTKKEKEDIKMINGCKESYQKFHQDMIPKNSDYIDHKDKSLTKSCVDIDDLNSDELNEKYANLKARSQFVTQTPISVDLATNNKKKLSQQRLYGNAMSTVDDNILYADQKSNVKKRYNEMSSSASQTPDLLKNNIRVLMNALEERSQRVTNDNERDSTKMHRIRRKRVKKSSKL